MVQFLMHEVSLVIKRII